MKNKYKITNFNYFSVAYRGIKRSVVLNSPFYYFSDTFLSVPVSNGRKSPQDVVDVDGSEIPQCVVHTISENYYCSTALLSYISTSSASSEPSVKELIPRKILKAMRKFKRNKILSIDYKLELIFY